MNRKNLTSLIILDIIVMALALGLMAYRYQALSSVPISEIKQNMKPAQPAVMKPLPEETVNPDDEAEAQAVVAEVTKPAKKARVATRNICFTYKNSKATKVQIIGDFTDWIPKKMTKAAGTWKINVQLAPGDYAYNYVVNGKPRRDPNNPKVTNAGRGFPNSFLKVQPFSNDNKKAE